MPQLNFARNIGLPHTDLIRISNGTMTFSPFNLGQSISWNTINIFISKSSANMTHTISIGLYSLNGSTLSLANSASGTFSGSNNQRAYVSLTATSATQNLTPATWFFGLLFSTGGNSGLDIVGQSTINAGNAFPGGFIGGRMTDSTNALPSSYATSNLDITGNDGMNVTYILLTA